MRLCKNQRRLIHRKRSPCLACGLGHAADLTAIQAVIQHRIAASLPSRREARLIHRQSRPPYLPRPFAGEVAPKVTERAVPSPVGKGDRVSGG